jgi:hypothetical protein
MVIDREKNRNNLSITKGGNMILKQVKDFAKSKGINPDKMKKTEIIKTIQRTEGNFDCFGTAAIAEYCDQQGCLWKTDCFNSNSK